MSYPLSTIAMQEFSVRLPPVVVLCWIDLMICELLLTLSSIALCPSVNLSPGLLVLLAEASAAS